MEECPTNEALIKRTACILTYSGAIEHIWINYLTLSVTLAVALDRTRCISSQMPDSTLRFKWLWASLTAFVGVILFQIILCWILGCAGISIVWCAVTGWIINERRRRRQHREETDDSRPHATEDNRADSCEDIILAIVFCVLVYYAVTAAVITTVAHFCALVLGALLSRFNERLVSAQSQTYEPLNGSSTPQT